MSFIFGSLLVVGVIVYAVAAFMYFLISSSHLVAVLSLYSFGKLFPVPTE